MFCFIANNIQATGIVKLTKAMQKIHTLRCLSLQGNENTEEGADNLASLFFNTKLQRLNISDSKLQTTGIKKLTKPLQNISLLTELCISKNDITEEAADDVAAALSSNVKLKVLCLSENNIHGIGVRKMVKVLYNFSTLTELDMSHNMFLITRRWCCYCCVM